MSPEPRRSLGGGDPGELLARARAGDPDATRALVLAWQPRVRNLVRYLVRGDDQVDDLSQQALLTALEKLHAYRGDGSLEAWLDGITLRITLRSMRRFRLARAREVEHDEDTSAAITHAPRYPDRRKLVFALDQVPEKQRSALVMHHVLGMSAREIAELERIPEETARSRLKHGMALLRASFESKRGSP
jgi:RNA polymerase sigma-70 factor (ECF subfamily)